MNYVIGFIIGVIVSSMGWGIIVWIKGKAITALEDSAKAKVSAVADAVKK